jgi:hypothetical protein
MAITADNATLLVPKNNSVRKARVHVQKETIGVTTSALIHNPIQSTAGPVATLVQRGKCAIQDNARVAARLPNRSVRATVLTCKPVANTVGAVARNAPQDKTAPMANARVHKTKHCAMANVVFYNRIARTVVLVITVAVRVKVVSKEDAH